MKKFAIVLLLIFWAVPSMAMDVYYNPVDGRIFYTVSSDRALNFNHTTNIPLSILKIDERRLDGANEPEAINKALRLDIIHDRDHGIEESPFERKYIIQEGQLYDNELEQLVAYDINPEKYDMKTAASQALTDLSTIISNSATLTDAQVRDALKKMAQHQRKIIKRLIQAM